MKYTVIKKTINKDLASFIYDYFLMKRQVAKKLFASTYISQFETIFGVWND